MEKPTSKSADPDKLAGIRTREKSFAALRRRRHARLTLRLQRDVLFSPWHSAGALKEVIDNTDTYPRVSKLEKVSNGRCLSMRKIRLFCASDVVKK